MVRLITAALVLSGLIVNAQSIRTYSFTPAGASVNEGTYKMLWQIGGITQGASSKNNINVYQDFFAFNELVAITSTEKYNSDDIAIYPNPASEYLNIENRNYEIQNYTLIDSKGNLIRNIKVSNFADRDQLDIANLTNGLYILQLHLTNNPKPIQIKILKK